MTIFLQSRPSIVITGYTPILFGPISTMRQVAEMMAYIFNKKITATERETLCNGKCYRTARKFRCIIAFLCRSNV